MQRFGQGSPYLRINGILTTPEGKAAWNVLQSIPAGNAHVYIPGVGNVLGYESGNYLESTGVTPASIDNPVGLVLDAAGSVGSELVVNGDFSNSITGWTIGGAATASVSSNTLTVARTNHSNDRAYRTISCVVGKSYQVTSVNSGGIANVSVATSFDFQGAVVSLLTTRAIFVATATTMYVGLGASANGTVTFNNVSVREVTGIHASQSTSGYRPILRQASGNNYWQFDGTDDRLALSAPLFQMADDHFICVGAKNNNGADYAGVIAVEGTTLDMIGITYAAGKCQYFVNAGGTPKTLSPATVITGQTAVLSASKTGTALSVDVNNAATVTDVSTGTGSNTMTKTSIGVQGYGGAPDYFGGNLYAGIVIKGTVSTAQQLILKKFIAKLSGVTL